MNWNYTCFFHSLGNDSVLSLAKKLFNRFALSKKSVTSFLSTSSGGSVESYCHLQMFSRWLNMILELSLGHLIY